MDYTDLHTHGVAGCDARSKDPETYLRMADEMAAQGTSAFLPTLFPAPVEEMRTVMRAVRRAMEFRPSSILGVHLEGPFVNPAKAGALPKECFVLPGIAAFSRLVGGYEDIVKIITIAPELPGAIGIIEKAATSGIRVNMGHSEATYREASEGRWAGASGVTHLFNAMSGVHHREPGLAGYALTDDRLYVELIADLAHVHPAAIRLALKCKPPERVVLVSDSLGPAKTAGVPAKGPLYMPDGRTLAGSGISLKDAVENLVSIGVPEERAASFASENPRRYLEGE